MNVEDIADVIIEKSANLHRVLVAIAGPPGAGKSTISEHLASTLANRGETVAIVPMDGFHLDNEVLKLQGTFKRKGAEYTFDALGFVDLIERLSGAVVDVSIPVFDREKDMAIADAQVVSAQTRILLVEGNYLLLNSAPWSSLHQYWHYSIFINPGIDVLTQRLIKRWLDLGLSERQAKERALGNDIPNAQQVLAHSIPPDLAI